MYVEYFSKEVKSTVTPSERQIEYLNTFKTNLNIGIDYYKALIPRLVRETQKYRDTMRCELLALKADLDSVISAHEFLLVPHAITSS